MFTFKTKHFSMLAVALTLMALSGSAFAQQTPQNAHTMFFGEGITKINMIQPKSNPNPITLGGGNGTFDGTNPTWDVSTFYSKMAPGVTTGSGPHDIDDSRYRLGTLGKSSLKGQTLSFEIVAGAIDRCSRVGTLTGPANAMNTPCQADGRRTGEVNHTGGFTITRGGYNKPAGIVSPVTGNFQRIASRRVQVVSLTIELSTGLISGLVSSSDDWTEGHTGIVNGRNPIFTISNITQSLEDNITYSGAAASASSATGAGTGARTSRFDTLWVQNLKVELDSSFAQFLNDHFSDTARFSGGDHVGYANFFAVGVPARVLPNYRDWVFQY